MPFWHVIRHFDETHEWKAYVAPVTALIDPDHPDKITLLSGFEHKDTIKSLLASRWDSKSGVWRLPLSWTSCLSLRGAMGDNLVLDPTINVWAKEERRKRVDPARTLRDAIDLEDGRSDLNEATTTLRTLQDELKLFPHQAVGAAYMATTEGCLIADETGTGKSAQSIAALRALSRMGKDPFPALIISPSSVKIPWQREFDRWYPGLQVSVVEGSAVQRRKQLSSPAHVYVMNWEQLAAHSRLASFGATALKRCVECGSLDDAVDEKKCEVHPRELNLIDFRTIVADELHRATAPSKQTRALWAIADKARYRFGLTGTPMQSNLDDLWFVLRYLFPKDFPAKGKFLDRYANIGYSIWGSMEILGLKQENEAEFQNVLAPIMRRMLKDVVLEFLPPIVTEERYVEMTGAQAKAYRDMKKKSFVEIDDKVLTASSALTRATRLVQFASSFAEVIITPGKTEDLSRFGDPDLLDELALEVTEPELPDAELGDFEADPASEFGYDDSDDFSTDLRLALPSNKISAFLGDVKSGDFGESSLVVFTQSRQLLELLSEQMTKDGYEHVKITGGQKASDRQQAIDDFQEGKVKYILVSIAAGGTGLTLTKADTMVFLQRPWSSTQFTQALARAHRIGSEQHESVTVLHYITKDSIEEWQMEALEGKFGRIEAILRDKDLLRKYLLES